MEKVRLFGLVLIVTTLILAMAVIATETFEIRIHRYYTSGSSEVPSQVPSAMPSGAPGSQPGPNDASSNQSEFVEIPILVPLSFAGGLGLLLWFVPGGLSAVASKPQSFGKRKRSRRRR